MRRSVLLIKKNEALLWGAVALLLILALREVGLFEVDRLWRGLHNLAIFAKDTVPPDLDVLPLAGRALWETIEMAFAGTLLGFVVSLPMGMMGARNISPWPLVVGVRLLVAIARTIPSLLWAVLFVIMVGLGPLAGTLGLALYTVGYLGKIYAELFEGVDPEVLEALKGVGASRLHLARFAVWPESANAALSQLLFMLEYNVRASSILGFAGAGGIGFYISLYLQVLDYQRLATLLLLILGLTLTLDVASAWLRERYLLQG